MLRRNMLLLSLLGALAACQPEVPAPQDVATPVVTAPVALSESAVQPVVSVVAPSESAESPAMPAKEKIEPVVKQKEAVKSTPVAKPAAAAPTPVAAPVVAEAKPEVKVVTAPSETDALALAKKSGCLICHAVDHKVVGPAWKDVAAKYRGDAGAEARLMDKVTKGGGGAWGAMSMPAQTRVSEADRRSLVRFVLSLK